MIKFIDGTMRAVDAKIITVIQCSDLVRLNYN